MSTEPVNPVPPTPPTPAQHESIAIGEEMDRGKWTLPPVGIVLIALTMVAVVLGIFALSLKQGSVSAGSVNRVVAQELPGSGSILVGVHVTVRNLHKEKPLYIQAIEVKLQTDQELSDSAAVSSDFDRLLSAAPDIKASAAAALRSETKIPVGGQASGMVLVSFPVSKAAFDARKGLRVLVDIYDRDPLVLVEGGAPPK